MKKLSLILASFFLTLSAYANVNVTMEISNADLTSKQIELLNELDPEMAQAITDLVEDGYKVTIEFSKQVDSIEPHTPIVIPFREKASESPCKVTVEKDRSGSGRVGHKKMGAEMRGEKKDKFTIEGPCNEVRKMMNDLRKDD